MNTIAITTTLLTLINQMPEKRKITTFEVASIAAAKAPHATITLKIRSQLYVVSVGISSVFINAGLSILGLNLCIL